MKSMNTKQCAMCDTYFEDDSDSTLCLACEMEREEAYEDAPNDWWDDGSEDTFYDDMYDGMTQDYGNAEY